MDYLESKYSQYLIKIPVVLFIIGFFIHNLYLSNFSEAEFEILQSKYIYIGTIASGLITIIIFFIIIRLDFEEPDNNLRFKDLLIWAVRIPVLAIIIHAFLFPKYNFTAGLFADYINYKSEIAITNFFRMLSFTFIFGLMWMASGVVWDKDKKIISVFENIYIILFVPTFILLLVTFSFDRNFFYIISFVFYLFLSVLFYIAGARDSKKGITTKASLLKNENTPFSKSITKYLSIIYLLFALTMYFVLYTLNLYPLLPQSFGGARAREVLLYTDADTLKVKLLNESSTWFLLQKSDSTIFKIKSSEVNKVQLLK